MLFRSLWAKDFEDKELFSFCFRYATGLFNYSCRLGVLTNDDRKAQLVEIIRKHCDINGVNLISDLYWSCLAFAYCHELAHIYLKHVELNNQPDTLCAGICFICAGVCFIPMYGSPRRYFLPSGIILILAGITFVLRGFRFNVFPLGKIRAAG